MYIVKSAILLFLILHTTFFSSKFPFVYVVSSLLWYESWNLLFRFLAEKYYRDAKIGTIYEGTSNIQLQTIGRGVRSLYSEWALIVWVHGWTFDISEVAFGSLTLNPPKGWCCTARKKSPANGCSYLCDFSRFILSSRYSLESIECCTTCWRWSVCYGSDMRHAASIDNGTGS